MMEILGVGLIAICAARTWMFVEWVERGGFARLRERVIRWAGKRLKR